MGTVRIHTIVQSNGQTAAILVGNPLAAWDIGAILNVDLTLSGNNKGGPLHELACTDHVTGWVDNINEVKNAVGALECNLVGVVGDVKAEGLLLLIWSGPEGGWTSTLENTNLATLNGESDTVGLWIGPVNR